MSQDAVIDQPETHESPIDIDINEITSNETEDFGATISNEIAEKPLSTMSKMVSMPRALTMTKSMMERMAEVNLPHTLSHVSLFAAGGTLRGQSMHMAKQLSLSPSIPEEPEEDSQKSLTKNQNMSLYIAFMSGFLDYLGMSIVAPILPFYAEEFGASASQLAALYTSFSGMIFLGVFIFGRFSDRFGRRPAICLILLGTAVGFLCSSLAQNYNQLLFSRFVGGLFATTQPVASSLIADVVPSNQVPKYYAILGAVNALSFILGPIAGGLLSQIGIRYPFYVSAGVSAVGFVVAIFVLEETNPLVLEKRKAQKEENSAADDSTNGTGDGTKVATTTSVSEQAGTKDTESKGSGINSVPIEIWILWTSFVFGAMGFTMFTAIFALFVIEKYGLGEIPVSLITLSMAVIFIFSLIFIFNPLAQRLGLNTTLFLGCVGLCLSSLVVPFIIESMWAVVCVICIGFGASLAHIEPPLMSVANEYANVNNHGLIMSIMASGKQLGNIIGPMIMGYTYELDVRFPFFVCAGCMSVCVMITGGMMIKWPHLRKPAHKRDAQESNDAGTV